LGEIGSLGTLSQTLPTSLGQRYLLSFWLDNPAAGTPNEFSVSWNGTTLFDQVNSGKFAWTNFQFAVSATDVSSVIQFGFRNDNEAFGLDDISVQPLPTPVLELSMQSDGSLLLRWGAVPGLAYQVQYTDDLSISEWNNRGSPITATTDSLAISGSTTSSMQRFYRVVLP
jgi:hypothetical protein